MLIAKRGEDYLSAPKYGVVSHGPLKLLISSPGGGGFGNLLERPADEVLLDVWNGVVSPASALSTYGVVLTDDNQAVNLVATSATRHSRGGRHVASG